MNIFEIIFLSEILDNNKEPYRRKKDPEKVGKVILAISIIILIMVLCNLSD